MRSLLVLAILVLSAQFGQAQISSQRGANEDFRSAKARHLFNFSLKNWNLPLTSYTTPLDNETTLKDFDVNFITELSSYEEVVSAFNYVRDSQFIKQENLFDRRITWLYPDDGCFIRAELSAKELDKASYPKPKKVFVFGNLTAESPNSTYGSVSWWYHVAVAYRVATKVYIFDASVNANKPLTLNEWHKAVGGDNTEATYAACDTFTFHPDSQCFDPTPITYSDAIEQQSEYLDLEWERLLELNRDPIKELGKFPPWL